MGFILVIYRRGWEEEAKRIASLARLRGIEVAVVEDGGEGPGLRVVASTLEAVGPQAAEALVKLLSKG